MENNNLLEMKRNNFMKAVNREEGAYVPTLITGSCATIGWAGKRAVDVLQDPQEFADAMTKVLDEMWVDVASQFGVLFTEIPEKVFDPVQFLFGPDGTTVEHIQLCLMERDEYPQFIQDMNGYIANVLLPRKYPRFFTDREWAKTALKAFNDDKLRAFIVLQSALDKTLEERYGVSSIVNLTKELVCNPFDALFDNFRGFRGTLTDLRRQRENVKSAVETIWENRNAPGFGRPLDKQFPYAVQYPHIAPYLNPGDFDEIYWPYEKKLLERVAEGGGKTFICLEGRWEKVWHHFLELPKDSCILLVDDDDFYKAYAELGQHHIICGGINSVDLKTKSFVQIQDDLKRLVDTCAPGGGFICCPNKAWVAPSDVNRTAIEAYNFIHEYSSK